MQIFNKLFFVLVFITSSSAFSQTGAPSIQSPTTPSIAAPSIVAPVVPSVPTIQLSTGSADETRTTSTSNNDQIPSALATELSASALETLSGLFTGSEENLNATALGEFESFSSLEELSTLLNTEITSTDDATTIALLQEILLKLSELEEKIDNLETEKAKD